MTRQMPVYADQCVRGRAAESASARGPAAREDGRGDPDAADRFSRRARPSAIILTHGHFDHVGALEHLAEHWDAPVYAHELEMPNLDGRASYPPADPTVGGG